MLFKEWFFSLRLKPMGARKVTAEFNSMLNSKTKYRNKNTAWSSVLLLKSRELAHHLVGKRKTLDFVKPAHQIERNNSDDMRQKIMDISYSEWMKMGFSKGTLHYMKQNAKSGKTFSLNSHVKERLKGIC
ncbi:CRISPR-associated protein Cas1 [Methanohalophilus levihalophilus]|uniref:CRISPR-associated protein Cas1 n=1 Tax=Methanohalophilus levihalophilus TaxID=1431282 RepID=UPI001AE100EB|nr:CRISPR-associated protein Cas1 [Methanohalophilus levihalophilus]MBP2029529.1 CRISPR-associated protein Cas1 [Methanohalophilus levihalophilus]